MRFHEQEKQIAEKAMRNVSPHSKYIFEAPEYASVTRKQGPKKQTRSMRMSILEQDCQVTAASRRVIQCAMGGVQDGQGYLKPT